MRRLILALLGSSLWAVAPAAAQQAASPFDSIKPVRPAQPPATIVASPAALLIATCDANADARVTRVELAACLARSFAAIDTAAKGSLGYIDFGDWALRNLGDRNALPSPYETDADNDNRITLAELQATFERYFTRFDIDKDGAVTRAELLTIRTGSEGLGRDGRGPGGRGGKDRR